MQIEQGRATQTYNISYYKFGHVVVMCCEEAQISLSQWGNINLCMLPYKAINTNLAIPVALAQNKNVYPAVPTMMNCIRLTSDGIWLNANAWGAVAYDNVSISFTFAYICE